MDRFFTLLVTLCVAGGLVYWVDRLPPINYKVPIPIIGPRIQYESLGAERDRAVKEARDAVVERRQCQSNEAGYKRTIGDQNRSIEELGRQGREIIEANRRAVERANAGRSSAEARAARLLASPPSGLDVCARMFDADDKVLESLK